MEFSGALGDLGTLFPIALGMILVNGLSPSGIFLSIGICYIATGLYFGVPVPIQPMKVIGAYAIATAMGPAQIMASGALMAVLLFIIGVSGAINVLFKYIPKSVVRGVQLSTGILLTTQGVKLMMGASHYQIIHQTAEPFLRFQYLGPIPIGIIIGAVGVALTLLLLENKRAPAGLIIVLGGLALGLVLGKNIGAERLGFSFDLPQIMPFGFPIQIDFTFAFFALVLPQIPMTIGNAVVAYVDLSREYFGADSRKLTHKSACISMAFANLFSFLVGGMPLCHGAGGLAAHYRFGARSAGGNLIIGTIFLGLVALWGNRLPGVLSLMPMAVLGVLLLFAGSQLALSINDLKKRKDFFVALLILGITLAANLAYGFLVGIVVAYALKSEKLSI